MTQSMNFAVTNLNVSAFDLSIDNNVDISTSKPVTHTIHLSSTVEPRQTLVGFGAALTESSCFNLMAPNLDTQTILEDLFQPNKSDGMQATFARITIGASDYSLSRGLPYSYRDQITDSFNAERDLKYVVPVLKQALKIQPQLRIVASPWSPPHWMTTQPGPRYTGAQFDPKYSYDYALYFFQYIEFMEQQGIPIYAVTVQNEQWNNQVAYPCMEMTNEQTMNFVSALVPLLRQHSKYTRVLVHDHNWCITQPTGCDQYRATHLLEAVQNFVEGVGWHSYQGDPCSTLPNFIQQLPCNEFYVTEMSALCYSYPSTPSPSGTLCPHPPNPVQDIDYALKHNHLFPLYYGSRGGLQWNIMLNTAWGPYLPEAGSSDTRGILTHWQEGDPSELAQLYYNKPVSVSSDLRESCSTCWKEPEYFALAHMNRAGPLGSKFLHAMENQCNLNVDLYFATFEQEDGEIGIVIFNKGEPAVLGFQLDGKPLDIPAIMVGTDQLVSGSLGKFLPGGSFPDPPLTQRVYQPPERSLMEGNFSLQMCSGCYLAAYGNAMPHVLYQSQNPPNNRQSWESWTTESVVSNPNFVYLKSTALGGYVGLSKQQQQFVLVSETNQAIQWLVWIIPPNFVVIYSEQGTIQADPKGKGLTPVHKQPQQCEFFTIAAVSG